MELGPQAFWETVLDTIDVAIRILGHVLSSKEGREFICGLGPRDAGLCLELLDRVSRYPPSRVPYTALQALAGRPLDGKLKKTFLLTIITLAGRYGRFPGSLAITDQIEVSDKIIASGGFADVKYGVRRNHPVAVKVLRTPSGSDMEEVRKVNGSLPFEANIEPLVPAVL